MTDLRWRWRLALAILVAGALCFTMRGVPALLAKDQDKDQPAKKQTAAEKAAAKKKARGNTGKKGQTGQSGSESSDSAAGTSAGGGGSGGTQTNSSSGANSGSQKPAANGGAGQGVSAAPPGKANPGKAGGPPQKGLPANLPLDDQHPLVGKAIKIQKQITADLLKQKGIVGTCVGLDDDDNVVIKVRTTGADNPKIPKQVDGMAITEVVTGQIRPFWQGQQFNTRARLPRPVPIGVSSVNERGQCFDPSVSAGTLGCRLRDKAGNVYALSNNHVFADENNGVEGDLIVQPGSLDAFLAGIPYCDPNDVIGTLFKFKPIEFIDLVGSSPIVFNLFDAGVMKTDVDKVSNSSPPPPIAYGLPRTAVWKKPFLGLKVQKFGRTTGFTKGIVSAINVISIVVYSNGIAAFDGQIEFIATNAASVGAPGDSGSLIVTNDPMGDRFPIALLFAGGGGFTDGNPIKPVLDYFDMTIDGDDSSFVPPGKTGRAHPNRP